MLESYVEANLDFLNKFNFRSKNLKSAKVLVDKTRQIERVIFSENISWNACTVMFFIQ